jgi:hypothetical protein
VGVALQHRMSEKVAVRYGKHLSHAGESFTGWPRRSQDCLHSVRQI